MSPRKTKDDSDHPCRCDASGFALPDGSLYTGNCRCHCRVPRVGMTCGMCTKGIHGVKRVAHVNDGHNFRVAGHAGE